MDQTWLLGSMFVLVAIMLAVMEMFEPRQNSRPPAPVSASRKFVSLALGLALIFVFRLIGGGDPFAPFTSLPSTAIATEHLFFAAVAATLFGLSLWWLSRTLSARRQLALPLASTIGTIALFMSFS